MYKTAYEKVLTREIAGRMHKQALWYPTYNRKYFIGPKKDLKDQRDSFFGNTYGEMTDILNRKLGEKEKELLEFNNLMRRIPGYDVSYEKHQAGGNRKDRKVEYNTSDYRPGFMSVPAYGVYPPPYRGGYAYSPYRGGYAYSPYRPAPAFYPPLY